jgi:hypothetical protein
MPWLRLRGKDMALQATVEHRGVIPTAEVLSKPRPRLNIGNIGLPANVEIPVEVRAMTLLARTGFPATGSDTSRQGAYETSNSAEQLPNVANMMEVQVKTQGLVHINTVGTLICILLFPPK